VPKDHIRFQAAGDPIPWIPTTQTIKPHSLTRLLERPTRNPASFFAAPAIGTSAPWVALIGAVVARSHPAFIAFYRPIKLIRPPVIWLHAAASLGFGCYVHRSNCNTEDRSEGRHGSDHVPPNHGALLYQGQRRGGLAEQAALFDLGKQSYCYMRPAFHNKHLAQSESPTAAKQ
jgi:hypothetical protein